MNIEKVVSQGEEARKIRSCKISYICIINIAWNQHYCHAHAENRSDKEKRQNNTEREKKEKIQIYIHKISIEAFLRPIIAL
jgi:hypothetical protein